MGKLHLPAALFAVTLGACSPGPAQQLPPPPNVDGPPADSETTESGLSYLVLEQGDGRSPSATDTVLVDYTGWTTDGQMFDSSVVAGQPISFPLTNVIVGWTECLQLMKEGASYRFWIPEELAYQGQPGRPPGMLVFDVDLYTIVE